MATTTTIQDAKEASGLTVTTTTEESFEQIDFPAEFTRATLTQTDGKYTLVYEAYTENGNGVVSCDASTSTEPLESHPYFDDIRTTEEFGKWTTWKSNPSDPSLNGWVPLYSTEAKIHDLYWWYASGITSYLAPRISVKETILLNEAPDLSSVGKLDFPPQGFQWNGNWVYSGATVQQEGTKWRLTREWLGSAQGKSWDFRIYGYNQ